MNVSFIRLDISCSIQAGKESWNEDLSPASWKIIKEKSYRPKSTTAVYTHQDNNRHLTEETEKCKYTEITMNQTRQVTNLISNYRSKWVCIWKPR